MPTHVQFQSVRVLRYRVWMPTRGSFSFSTAHFVKAVLFCKYSALALFAASGENTYGPHFFSPGSPGTSTEEHLPRPSCDSDSDTLLPTKHVFTTQQQPTTMQQDKIVHDQTDKTEADAGTQSAAAAPIRVTSQHDGSFYTLKIHSQKGSLASAHVEATFKAPPKDVLEILSCRNLAIWNRGVKQVNSWQSIQTADQKQGTRAFEFEQVSELAVLWMRHRYNMKLRVFEDARDPADLKMNFEMIECGMLESFSGSWHFLPLIQPSVGGAKPEVHTRVVLDQDLLPKGVHPALKRLPVLGNMLAGTVVGPLQQLMDDLADVVKQLNTSGKSVSEVLAMREAKFFAAHPEIPPLRD